MQRRMAMRLCRMWLAVGVVGVLTAMPAQSAAPEPGVDESAPPSRPRLQTLPSDQFKNGSSVRAAFRGAVQRAGASTVRVVCDGKEAALGTVVGSDGWIVTKASELAGVIVCRFSDGRELEAQIVGVADDHDLAMLKVNAAGLAVVKWQSGGGAAGLRLGQWVATPDDGGDAVAVGVVSVQPRKLHPGEGKLGVMPGRGDGGVRIRRVVANSGADKAGLRVNDVITRVGQMRTPNASALRAAVGRYTPGQTLELGVKRGEEELVIPATLGRLELLGEEFSTPADFQNRMGSRLSTRRGGFPAVLQHDSVLRPSDCGGPLVALDGQVVGINIARAGRTESYAIPAGVVQSLLKDLKSGKLAPKTNRSSVE